MSPKSEIIERAIRRAHHSMCRYQISAVGLNRKGEVIRSTTNHPRFSKDGGGVHAEMKVMRTAGPALHIILLCRVNDLGEIRRILPCEACARKARELGVKIINVADLKGVRETVKEY